jgi:hypothetical protein
MSSLDPKSLNAVDGIAQAGGISKDYRNAFKVYRL